MLQVTFCSIFASRYGVVYHGIHDDHMEVTFKGEMRRYKPLHVLEFDAVRKMMSVIIQNEKGTSLIENVN